ncbi:hypothetical protein BpHYR1_005989 [Brachionus plicatilis]|uniref:Uncharacterized protein n=1 Tax=Brachionus plicatilis TaxID=10195 RepID=A0A3M7SWY9_BRAPC|nr:hypothetical protein BpHYR1_005989 [Brachionus plicatilis]
MIAYLFKFGIQICLYENILKNNLSCLWQFSSEIHLFSMIELFDLKPIFQIIMHFSSHSALIYRIKKVPNFFFKN